MERYVELKILRLTSNSSQFTVVHTHKKVITSVGIGSPWRNDIHGKG